MLLLAPLIAAAEEPAPPPPFASVCFDDFTGAQEFPSREAVHRMLAEIPGAAYGMSEESFNNVKPVIVSGLSRLADPWPADHALRLSFLRLEQWRIYLWNGKQGVALYYCPAPWACWSEWAAYATTRTGTAPRPDTFALWAGDEGRFSRCGGGTFALHYEEGNLVMTRGNLRMLSVPFSGPPAEVYFEGKAMIRGMALVPCRGVAPPPATLPLAMDRAKQAEMVWTNQSPARYQLNVSPEGAVELASKPGPEKQPDPQGKAGIASLTLGEPNLYLYDFELESPQAGTGIFLGNAAGEPLYRLGIVKQQNGSRLMFEPGLDNDRDSYHGVQCERELVPWMGTRQWFRLILGAGIVRCWTSGDGLHWVSLTEKPQRIRGECRQIGLYCFPGKQPRAIKLHSLAIRRLDALLSLVPEAVLRQTPLLAEQGDSGNWLMQCKKCQPADVSPQEWQRACVLRTLAGGPTYELGQHLLLQLLGEVSLEPGQYDARLQLFQQAALLVDTWETEPSARVVQDLGRVQQRLLRQRDPAPFTRILPGLIDLPVSPQVVNMLTARDKSLPGVRPWELLRFEVLLGVYEERWEDVAELGRRMTYWARRAEYDWLSPAWVESSGLVPIMTSAMAQATAQLPDRQPIEKAAPPPEPVHGKKKGRKSGKPRAKLVPYQAAHPLVERLSREACSVAAELQSALASNSYAEAARIIHDAGDTAANSLVFSADDPHWMLSLAVTAEQALAAAPELRQAMQSQFGPLGELRFKQAVAAADAAAVEAVTTQFPGTRGAADAHAWLGDRLLAAGRFCEAIGHFQTALDFPATSGSADAEYRDGLSARLRLATALLGRPAGVPITAPVQLGSKEQTAAEFERLIDELRRARADVSPPSGVRPESAGTTSAALPQGRYEGRPWSHIALGRDHKDESLREFQWSCQQLACTFAGARMLIASPLLLASFDLDSGRQQWQQQSPAEWSRLLKVSVPMQAVVSGAHVFQRRLFAEGIGLSCFDLQDGRVLWDTRPPGENLVSDPLLFGSRIFLFSTAGATQDDPYLHLQLCRFNADSGELNARVPLADFRNSSAPFTCRTVALVDRIVASAAGCVFCCDLGGHIRWLRRQICLPNEGDNGYNAFGRYLQTHGLPLVAERRLYVTQPGVWKIECLDLDSGRMLWQRAEPGLRRLLGVNPQRLLAETTAGLLALDARSGKELWTHEEESHPGTGRAARLAGGVFDDPEVTVYALLRNTTGESWSTSVQPYLLWLNAHTGEKLSETLVEAPDRKPANQAFGPLFFAPGRQWVRWPARLDSTEQEILELIRAK
jgi:tetratricopeptide (TPR) repeat protein